jgi:hypothetical protein
MPSGDEPALKASFSISTDVPAGPTALQGELGRDLLRAAGFIVRSSLRVVAQTGVQALAVSKLENAPSGCPARAAAH